MSNNANEELNNIDNWLVTNKLSLNIDKSKCMHFKTLNTPTPNLTLKISNTPIQKISFFKLLVVILDEHLLWKDHILERIRPRCLQLFFLIFELSRFQLASLSLSLSLVHSLSRSFSLFLLCSLLLFTRNEIVQLDECFTR